MSCKMYAFLKRQCINIRQRWVFAVMCFFGTIHVYALRACLPITMTEMVLPIESEAHFDDSCPSNIPVGIINTTSEAYGNLGEKYDWGEYQQGIILSSFYYGYILTHIPGGLLAAKYGGKHILGSGIFVASVCTLLIPLAVTHADSVGLIIVRAFAGLGQGIVYPAVSTMLSQWAPPEERARTGSFVYGGEIIGTIYANSAGGALLHYFGSWTSVFYSIGGTGVIWYVLWLILCYSTPREHPFISQKETDYLTEKIGDHRQEKPGPIPWLQMWKSGPLWAAGIALLGFDWSLITILTYLPKYMSSVLKISIENNGYLNSAICICMWIGGIIASFFADLVVEKQFMSRTMARKTGAIAALVGSASFVVGASYAGCDQILVIIMFAISMAMLAIAYSSTEINTLDLSPNYAGTMMAIVNAISCGVSGSLSPYIISILAPDQTLGEWRIVFWLLFIISVITTGIYLYLGSAEVQYWNDPKNVNSEKVKSDEKVEEFSVTEISSSDL